MTKDSQTSQEAVTQGLTRTIHNPIVTASCVLKNQLGTVCGELENLFLYKANLNME